MHRRRPAGLAGSSRAAIGVDIVAASKAKTTSRGRRADFSPLPSNIELRYRASPTGKLPVCRVRPEVGLLSAKPTSFVASANLAGVVLFNLSREPLPVDTYPNDSTYMFSETYTSSGPSAALNSDNWLAICDEVYGPEPLSCHVLQWHEPADSI